MNNLKTRSISDSSDSLSVKSIKSNNKISNNFINYDLNYSNDSNSSNNSLSVKSIKSNNETLNSFINKTNYNIIENKKDMQITLYNKNDYTVNDMLFINPYPSAKYRNLHNYLLLLKLFNNWRKFIKSENSTRIILHEWKNYSYRSSYYRKLRYILYTSYKSYIKRIIFNEWKSYYLRMKRVYNTIEMNKKYYNNHIIVLIIYYNRIKYFKIGKNIQLIIKYYI